MSQHIGKKGHNATSKPRKKPTIQEISRNIETGRKLWSIRPIMSNILPAKKNLDGSKEVVKDGK